MILLSLVISTKTVFAETAKLEIVKTDINVMPEYDMPNVLIIYSVEIKNTSDQIYSGEFVWNLPKSSTKYTVVDRSKGDNHVDTTLKQGEKNNQIVWKFPTPLQPGEIRPVQIEYYFDNLQGNPDKTFVYEYIPEYQVVQALVTVFQPQKASNMSVTPDFGQPQSGYDGFTVFKKEYNNLKPTDSVLIKVSYTKSDPTPSVPPLSEKKDQSTQSSQSLLSKVGSDAGVLFFIAAFVVVLGLISYKVINSKQTSEKRSREADYQDEFIMDEEIRRMQNSNNKQPSNRNLKAEKKKLREALLNGRISEETYHQLVAEITNDEEEP